MRLKSSGVASFARNTSGNTTTEFVLLIPIILSLIVFTVEGSVQLFTRAVLQYGLREATRFGSTGAAFPPNMAANPPASREAAIPLIIAEYGLGLINSSYLSVSLTSYSAFSAVGAAGQGSAGAGGPGAVVQYQVVYFQRWMFPGSAYPAATATGWSGIQHTLTMVVQNEAFPAN
jgi:hypothetical protein